MAKVTAVSLARRIVAFFALMFLGFSASASFLTNNFADSGYGSNTVIVNFVPITTPYILTNGEVIYSRPISATATNGVLTTNSFPNGIAPGNYTVTVNPKFGNTFDKFQIGVPYDNNVYGLYQLTNTLTFLSTNFPHGILTAVVAGTNITIQTNGTVDTINSSGGGGGGGSALPDGSTIVTNAFGVFSTATNITHLSVTAATVTVSNGVAGTATNHQDSGSISILNNGTNVFNTSTNGPTAIGSYLTIQQYLTAGYLTFSGWFDTDSLYPALFGRYSWSSNTADFLGKHYLGNTFYTILGDTTGGGVITPTFGSRYQTNFSGASFSFGNPVGVENSGLTPLGWNELGVLVSNTIGSAITGSFPATWTNSWVTNGLTANIPAHSVLLFTVSVVPGFMTNVSWSSGLLSSGGGGAFIANLNGNGTNTTLTNFTFSGSVTNNGIVATNTGTNVERYLYYTNYTTNELNGNGGTGLAYIDNGAFDWEHFGEWVLNMSGFLNFQVAGPIQMIAEGGNTLSIGSGGTMTISGNPIRMDGPGINDILSPNFPPGQTTASLPINNQSGFGTAGVTNVVYQYFSFGGNRNGPGESNYVATVAQTNSIAASSSFLNYTNRNFDPVTGNAMFVFGAGTNAHWMLYYTMSGQSLDGTISYETYVNGIAYLTNNGTSWGVFSNQPPTFIGPGGYPTGITAYVNQTGLAVYSTAASSVSHQNVFYASSKPMTR